MFVTSLAKLRWNQSPTEIIRGANEAVQRLRSVYDAVSKSAASNNVSVETILTPVIEAETEYASVRAMFEFPQHVSPDKAARDASHDAAKTLSSFDVETSMRKDLFEAFSKLDEQITSRGPTLPSEHERFARPTFPVRVC